MICNDDEDTDGRASQKFVMEGVQNRGHIGAGEGGVSGEGVSLP